MKDLTVKTSDTSKISDKLSKWKPWFNGSKFFHTVKVLPINLGKKK